MGGHAGRAQDNAVTIGTGGLGKISGGFGRAVGREDVCLKRDAEILEHRAGRFYDRPITVRPHDDGNFFHGKLLSPKSKKRSAARMGTLRYTSTAIPAGYREPA